MPTPNQERMDRLFAEQMLQARQAPLLQLAPDPPSSDIDWDRVEGMMLGLAIGDALGNTSESMTPHDRRLRYGEIRDYLTSPWSPDGRGSPSDDTQLAYWTLDQTTADGGLIPEQLAARFDEDQILGIGQTVSDFLDNYARFLDGDLALFACGPQSAGNGALMRIAPVLIPHLRRPSAGLWADAVLAAALTHNDSASIATCVAFVDLLWRALHAVTPPPPDWWHTQFVSVAMELETGSDYQPRAPRFESWRGPLWRFVAEHVPAAAERGLTTVEACDAWRSGAYLLETVPSVLYILMRHAHDPEEAIIRAVNDTWDNDSVAAIVGAAVGAQHGRRALPSRWISRLSGRTRAVGDDGAVFTILERARRRWWEQ